VTTPKEEDTSSGTKRQTAERGAEFDNSELENCHETNAETGGNSCDCIITGCLAQHATDDYHADMSGLLCLYIQMLMDF